MVPTVAAYCKHSFLCPRASPHFNEVFHPTALPARQASLRHGSILLLEPIAQSLGTLHVLVYASHNATFFARGEGLAFEAVDAAVEALLDEVRVHLAEE